MSLTEPGEDSQRPNGSVLTARHPTSQSSLLTKRQGHDLALDLEGLGRAVLTCQRLGQQPPELQKPLHHH